jgi:XTP/dITP diphosphohydrolase
MHLLIASTNAGKIREFREMLGGREIAFSDLTEHREILAPEETGRTFRANACLKASYYSKQLSTWSLADDSGLAVDALDGRPGVHSARWAEMNHAGQGDANNNQLLLKQLENVPDEKRTARFVCVLALSDPKGRILLTAMDSLEGRIIRDARGENGFGYDPLFWVDEAGMTTAELEPERKHEISHRGKALRKLRELMASLPPSPRLAPSPPGRGLG